MSATTTPSSAGSAGVAGSAGDPLAEAVELTRRLKLPHIRRHLLELVPTARAQRWDHAELVRVLLAEEAAGRDATNLRTRRARAGFPAGKTLQDWDASASTIPRPTQDALTSLEWVGRRENLCVCGPSGTGKSHFCEALGQAAVEAGMTVAWFTIEDLGAFVRRHRADDSITRALARLIRTDLIIVDDIGLLPVSPDAAEGFYRLVDAAYERRSLAVSSNLHPSGFDEIMPKTLATATVDRLLHHAHIVVTQGDSYRLAQATSGKGVSPLT
ncbi:IS21-like element helper ATPase IstB [Pseudonocardia dioxanivorans]|uniref:IS21-like element helper ATPase IstB n=1 Tax=Pseudonocardia dioxanivorans TaxID=240495 RepID=UPI000CD0807D|nr:IS21-like element helper ATPase IstB [Pseudonocardia dioxanivorans]